MSKVYTVAVVGGGPTGVELAGTLAEIARHTLRNEFRHIDPASAKVRLVEAGPRVLSTFPEVLSLKARRQLEKLGVEVLTGTPVSDINGDGFQLGNQFVPARTVVWAAGVAASPLARTLEVPLDRAITGELPSEGTALGALQVPPSGQPVLFLADHPLTGGYPVIGCVAPYHLDRAGQIPVGAWLRFNPIQPFAELVPESGAFTKAAVATSRPRPMNLARSVSI